MGTTRSPVDMRAAVDTVRAVLRHPSVWLSAVVQLRRMAPEGWWRRKPYLPVPDPEYLRFRMQTMYGDAEHRPDGDDVVTYLRWCKRFPDASR